MVTEHTTRVLYIYFVERTNIILKPLEGKENIPMTDALAKAKEALVHPPRIAVLVGPKQMKTKYGRYILQTAEEMKYKLIIRNVEEWKCLKIKEKDHPNIIIFIDNFGVRKDVYESWEPYLDEIYSACVYYNVTAIIGMDNTTFKDYLAKKKHHRILSKKYVVELSEKERCFKAGDGMSFQEIVFIAGVILAIAVVVGLYLVR